MFFVREHLNFLISISLILTILTDKLTVKLSLLPLEIFF